MKTINKSAKLSHVLYDVRGPIVDAARQMEEEGQKIIRLNIGNLAPFGFDAPEEIQQDMIRNLPQFRWLFRQQRHFCRTQGGHALLAAAAGGGRNAG